MGNQGNQLASIAHRNPGIDDNDALRKGTDALIADLDRAVRQVHELADEMTAASSRAGIGAVAMTPGNDASAPPVQKRQSLQLVELSLEDLADACDRASAANIAEKPGPTPVARATDAIGPRAVPSQAPVTTGFGVKPHASDGHGRQETPVAAAASSARPVVAGLAKSADAGGQAGMQPGLRDKSQPRLVASIAAQAPTNATAETARLDPASPQAKRTPDSPRQAPPLIQAERGPLGRVIDLDSGGGKGGSPTPPSGGGGGGNRGGFHKPAEMPNFAESFQNGVNAVRHNLAIVMAFTLVINVLVLAIPVYLFQISDRVLTSRSLDTLAMLTIVVIGAVLLQAVLDAIRRFILMRTAVEVEAQLGAPILAAAARSSLNGSSRDYQVLGDLQQLRSFITSGTLIAILDVPLAPIFIMAVFFVHPQLGYIVVVAALCLLVIALINQRMTARHFSDSSAFLSRAALHLDSMSRNSQIINALAMIPEAVRIWGKDTALSLKAQVRAQDRNIILATLSKSTRLITQISMLGWGAYLSIEGELTGGMVIASSIISARALTPIEGAIEGWHSFTQFRHSFARIRSLLQTSPLNFQRLLLPEPKGRLDVERILFVPPPNKKVILNGVSFSLKPGESLAVIGNSGAGKTTLGKMLVGSILPTSGSVRLDLMDLRNWDQRQFGENIGYLPQDVQLFPGTIKANIGRMRDDASDREIYEAAMLADVHELIASFPQGYETVVAGDGAPLSGGQKQRIALARAFFGNPKLVVLDEPNSNLDSPGEVALSKALLHARKQNITVVTITQRTALLNHVDKILVLNNGAVSAFGSRNDVLKAIAPKKNDGAGNRPVLDKDV